ncbi:MAG: alpha/beta fold hydrolase [Gammaproteobacteria bacterium]|nr:alpha/beta fold hydrolase [Gammaproteobacteria bacterium]MYE52988.1 alpha/beta fold hydrolase [Gammaproteobacteria bacterium]MYF48712.1 alpha/beta fold hydrolase [Gammaproteobacteria bacterium]
MATAQSAGAPIYYETSGEGPALLFAHGAGGNAAIWFQQTAHFAGRFNCIAFDHRGFARSPAPPSTLTAAQFRDDALAVLDAAGVDRAHVVAQSMGGYTALRLALDAPDRVASVTLSGTSGGLPNEQPSEALKALVSGNASSGIAATMARATKADKPKMALYAAISAFNTAFSFANLADLVGDGGPSLADARGIACPVLFVAGREDPLFPPSLLASYVPHFPNARITVVDDAGHSPYYEQPEVFNALLDEFLDGQRG